jgi:hypothetical protein
MDVADVEAVPVGESKLEGVEEFTTFAVDRVGLGIASTPPALRNLLRTANTTVATTSATAIPIAHVTAGPRLYGLSGNTSYCSLGFGFRGLTQFSER